MTKLSTYVISKLTNYDWLYNEYVILGHSTGIIGNTLGISSETVRRYLLTQEIPIRHTMKGIKQTEEHKHNSSISAQKRYPYNKHRDEIWLRIQYVDNHKTAYQIAEEINVSANTIYYWLNKFGIDVRDRSESRKGKRGERLSEEVRAIRSKCLKTLWQDPKFRQDRINANRSPITIEKIRTTKKNKIISDETRKKWSISHSGKNNGMYGKPCAKIKGDHYTKTDGTIIWLRSSYEIRVAKMLDKLVLNWCYEPKSFSIDDHRTYRPDFYLTDLDIWWEVKGWLDEYARYKIIQFWEHYPEETLRIIWKEDIEQLETLSENSDLYNIIMIGEETLSC